MVGMPVADEDIVCLDCVYIHGSSQFIGGNERVKKEFFSVDLNAEAGVSVIGELHENPDFVRMANLIVRHHFWEQYINIGCYNPY
jgi:hypothetical protein